MRNIQNTGREKQPEQLEQLKTKAQVATFLQVTSRTVEKYHTQGLPHFKLGPRRTRYRLQDVMHWLSARA